MTALPDAQRCADALFFSRLWLRCDLHRGHEGRHSAEDCEDTGTRAVTVRWDS
jgi:hypothetical protein